MQQRSILLFFILILLLIFSSLTQAQTTDFCNGIADEIAYNGSIEGEITASDFFGRYCFRGREGDVVNIQIEVTDGDLILEGALSDQFIGEVFEEYTAESGDDVIEIEFTLPEEGSYLLLVSRAGFGEGTTTGTYSLSLTSDNEPLSPEENNTLFPATLSNYDGYYENIIGSLQSDGAIDDGGQLIFNLQSAFFDGVGSFFTPVASSTSRRDVIVAAELTFTTDSDSLETCSLLARVVGRDNVDTFLEVGLDNNGDVFWVDSRDDVLTSGTVETGVDLSESHHLLFIAQSSYLTIYLDGELIVEMTEITVGSGSFGIALLGGGQASRCDGANFWGYAAPVVVDGLCEATPYGDVNQRSSASTNATIAGVLENGEYVEVIARTTDNSDYVWYQLKDESFVRQDVVSLAGDCGNLPDSEE